MKFSIAKLFHTFCKVSFLLILAACFLQFFLSLRISAHPKLNAARMWNNSAFQGVRDAKLGAPIASRALAIVDTCMYDAWAAYNERAVGTQLVGALRRPSSEHTEANKEQAISYAAYRALADILPADVESVYKPLMKELGYDPNDNSTDIETPTGIGNVACAALLEYRHHDGANQLGDEKERRPKGGGMTSRLKNEEQNANLKIGHYTGGPYEDWSGYEPANPPELMPARFAPKDPNRWQPLIYVDSNGGLMTQRFAGVQWCFVTPFALKSGDELRSIVAEGPAKYGSAEYEKQARELIDLSAGLTDRQKAISEYWADGPGSEQPPGHWLRLAEFVSIRDHHSLDDDVKMFFALSNAMLDAGIAAWDAKRTFDSVRPVTAISFLYRGKKIRAWGGPGKGTVELDGSQWMPYQPATFPTPPFPDFVSGHSTYSAAAARILELWTGSEQFGGAAKIAKGSSKIEPGVTPREEIELRWKTFAEAAEEAGMSRRYGGIHFAKADLMGRKLGRAAAENAWSRAQKYFDGVAVIQGNVPAASSGGLH